MSVDLERAQDAAPEPSVLVESVSSALVLTLNRPDRLNAVSLDMYHSLLDSLDRARRDPSIRSVVLTGRGRGFCVGADLKAHGDRPMDEATRHVYIDAAQEVNRALQDHPGPVIAAVNGHAIGAGLELALSADLVVAAEEAKFRLPEIALGTFVGGGVTYTLVQRLGMLKAKELLFMGEFFSGLEAARMGLVNEAVPAARVLERGLELAERVGRLAPVSLRLAKELLAAVQDLDRDELLAREAEALRTCMRTGDWKEGIDAFREKREPIYRGE